MSLRGGSGFNVQYVKLIERTKRIIRELDEITNAITAALQRPIQPNSIKLNVLRNRVKDAKLHLSAALPIPNNDNTQPE